MPSSPSRTPVDTGSITRVGLLGLGLFLAANGLYMLARPLPFLESISAYNVLFPGRPRLPYAEDSEKAYSLSPDRIVPMMASHEVSAEPRNDEYRVFILGDSSVWGFLLSPDQTLTGQINRAGLHAPDGRRLRAFNLGYPVMSLFKDLYILQASLDHRPDLVVWMISLEALSIDKQLSSELVQSDPQAIDRLNLGFALHLPIERSGQTRRSMWQRTILGERRSLADWIRLQLYGVMWSATGIDQYYPPEFVPTPRDLSSDLEFHDAQPPDLMSSDLALEVLAAGDELLGDLPLLIVNEPIYISDGSNSDLRYNELYPRWAYDDYRVILAEVCSERAWDCRDFWDLIAPDEFTNTAIHLTPEGTRELADLVGQAILEAAAHNRKAPDGPAPSH